MPSLTQLSAKPHYRRAWHPGRLWLVLIVGLILVRLVSSLGRSSKAYDGPIGEGVYQVRYVIDGDTLLLENNAKVRLLGIDTPETVQQDHPVEAWGPEATEFTQQFVDSSAGWVKLTFEAERVDRYGRWLAYVWSNAADSKEPMLNEQLVRQGLARAELQYRYSQRMKKRFGTAEQQARQAGIGIWSVKTGLGVAR